MKQISYWALLNPVKARIIIVLCQILLILLTFYSGIWLFAQDVFVPRPFLYLGFALFLTGLALYPIRRARYKFWKYNYTRQKSMDALLLVGFVFMAITTANNDAHAVWRDTGSGFQARQTMLRAERQMNASDFREKGWSFRELKQELKSRYKHFLSKKKQSANFQTEDSGKVAGVVLLMVILMLAIAALACFAACSGDEALGVLIWIGGWAIILVLGIRWIRKIKGQRPANYQPMKMHD